MSALGSHPNISLNYNYRVVSQSYKVQNKCDGQESTTLTLKKQDKHIEKMSL